MEKSMFFPGGWRRKLETHRGYETWQIHGSRIYTYCPRDQVLRGEVRSCARGSGSRGSDRTSPPRPPHAPASRATRAGGPPVGARGRHSLQCVL
jgi:hypothetical protein